MYNDSYLTPGGDSCWHTGETCQCGGQIGTNGRLKWCDKCGKCEQITKAPGD